MRRPPLSSNPPGSCFWLTYLALIATRPQPMFQKADNELKDRQPRIGTRLYAPSSTMVSPPILELCNSLGTDQDVRRGCCCDAMLNQDMEPIGGSVHEGQKAIGGLLQSVETSLQLPSMETWNWNEPEVPKDQGARQDRQRR